MPKGSLCRRYPCKTEAQDCSPHSLTICPPGSNSFLVLVGAWVQKLQEIENLWLIEMFRDSEGAMGASIDGSLILLNFLYINLMH